MAIETPGGVKVRRNPEALATSRWEKGDSENKNEKKNESQKESNKDQFQDRHLTRRRRTSWERLPSQFVCRELMTGVLAKKGLRFWFPNWSVDGKF